VAGSEVFLQAAGVAWGKTMAINVLVAEEDMDVHELVADILEINFKNVKIDRALDYDSFLKKVNGPEEPYHLIIMNESIGGEVSTKDVVEKIRAAQSNFTERLVLLSGAEDECRSSLDESLRQIPFIKKPFSLDGFGEIVKKVCAR
jgi:DNA-binding NtrC family response regulator